MSEGPQNGASPAPIGSVPGSSAALNSGTAWPGEAAAVSAPAKSRRKLWIIVGAVITLLVLAAIGAGVGVAVSNNNKKSSSNSSPDNSGSGDGGGQNNNTTSPGGGNNNTDSDPYSNFEKDPRLKKVFYGMAYTPARGIAPECGVTLEEVIKDVQLMSQLTGIVRLYGGDCGLPGFFLQAINLTKVDIQVYLGNYISVANPDAYTTQKAAIETALQTYGTDHVVGVTVGNEVMLNYALDQGATDGNAAVAQPAADYIIECIADTRASLAALGFGNLKVGNADAGSWFSNRVLEASDYGLSNVHPWFAHLTVSESVEWTWQYFQETNVDPAALMPNKPEMFLAETGWPTGANLTGNPSAGNDGAGVGGEASVANLQIFLDNFICQSNTRGVKYFYFELFDQLWKDVRFGGVEGYWGLLDANQQLKPGIVIPDCT